MPRFRKDTQQRRYAPQVIRARAALCELGNAKGYTIALIAIDSKMRSLYLNRTASPHIANSIVLQVHAATSDLWNEAYKHLNCRIRGFRVF